MSDWSHGYNTALGYTYHFYRETTPLWLDWAARLKGCQAPAGDRFRYLELGCGQGVGLCLIAALHPDCEFVGIDFNPQHIAHARDLAQNANLRNVRFEEADFMILSRDWPHGQFHFAVLHGIYSWITEDLRRAVCACLEQALMPGGLVYVSYNSLPGWISALPLQKLLRRHQAAKGLHPLAAIEQGFRFMDQLRQSKAAMFTALPQLNARMDNAIKQDRSYLVQEYLHENWHPLWFSQVCQEMGHTKLGFIGTATLPENYLPALLPESMRELVQAQDDPLFAQEVIDCLINQSFRRDIFQRGVFRPWPAQQSQGLGQARFALISLPKDYVFKTTFGDISGKVEIYDAIVQSLRNGPKSVAELNQPLAQAIQALTFLLHQGTVGRAAERPDPKSATRFNKAVAKAVAQGAPYAHIACAAIASGLATDAPTLMLLDALADNTPAKPDALAAALTARLRNAGRQLAKDGQAITDPQALAAEAARCAQTFLKDTLPRYKTLGAWT
jgi:SAM-dependent methyltransferase